MMEIWKSLPIEGLEHYQVSNTGRVRNSSYKGTGRIRNMSPCSDKDGYQTVCLTSLDGKQKSYRVHRLVAQVFIYNPDNLEQVNHLDENKANNSVDNLEWCTSKQNNNYGHRNERMSRSKRNTNCRAVRQCDKNGVIIRVWPSLSELKRTFGYDTGLISSRCRGKGETAYGYRWEYA